MGNYGGDALCTTETTIASGASLSSAISLQSNATTYCGLRLFGIIMPSEWTAANLTFQASFDGGTNWYDLYDADGNEFTAITGGGTDKIILFSPSAFSSVPMIKVRSGSSDLPVVQGAERSLILILRGV